MARHEDVPNFGLLNGVKVAFTGNAIAGPYAAELWAENGADVIWIENPRNPDPARNPMALMVQRDRQNMRTIAMNMKTPEGQEALLKILAESDIFLEASRGGQLAGWGLPDEKLWEVNPSLVIIHVSGFGQTGLPDYIARGAWDTIGQAFSGYVALNGLEDPIAAKPQLCDFITALQTCWSGMAALYRAKVTGEGESIDVAMYEAMLRVQNDNTQQFGTNGAKPERSAEASSRTVGYRNYRCKDGEYIALVMAGPAAMKGVLPLLGLEWGSDDFPAFMPVIMAGTPGAARFSEAIERFCSERTASDAEAEIAATGAAVQRILSYEDIFSDPHVKARESLFDFEDPERGLVKGAAAPMPKLVKHPQKLWRNAPKTGADTRDILIDLGYTDEEIAELAEQGIVAVG